MLQYVSIAPTDRNAVPVSLICNETVTAAKENNLRRFHSTKFARFKKSFFEQTETCQKKKKSFEILILTYKSSYLYERRQEVCIRMQ